MKNAFLYTSMLVWTALMSTSMAWDFQTQYGVQRLQSDFYPEGERHNLFVAAREGRAEIQQNVSYNTTFGLNEKVYHAQYVDHARNDKIFWAGVGFGADAFASSKFTYNAGGAHQINAYVNANLDLIQRYYRNSTVSLGTVGSDVEIPWGVLFTPRVTVAHTNFGHNNSSGDTVSWFVKASYLYNPLIRPYVLYGDGKELDSQLGSLLTSTIRTTTYGGGASFKSLGPINASISYEHRDLKSLDREYDLLGVSLFVEL